MNFQTTYRELVASSRNSIEFERGSALALGYALGVTASHGDTLDYRAMLARVLVDDSPAANVRYELANDEPLRVLSLAKAKATALESELWNQFVGRRKRPTLSEVRDIWLTVAVIRDELSKYA